MLLHFDWVKDYLKDAPSLDEAAKLLNSTGLETEINGEGLDIEYTVNRSDAMSHFGVARELAVKLGSDTLKPPIDETPFEPLSGWAVQSCDPLECPQYMALKIENVTNSPSPAWLVSRLEAIGQTSHGLLVDLTNFLLWEHGHPCHAFDAQKIQGQTITIRFGVDGEQLITLDERKHNASGLLCIADSQRPIAFAGVMGGLNSQVDDQTQSILLELAVFHPSSVRQTGRQCRIHSDARHRFERGIDREQMEHVMRRYVYLLKQEQPDAIVVGLFDMNLKPFQRIALTLRKQRLHRLLGIEIDEGKVLETLTAMDCRPQPTTQGWDIQVPGFKVDVTREIDIVEEVIRFQGLDALHSELPAFRGVDLKPNVLRLQTEKLRQRLIGFGFQETCSYAFLSRAWDLAFEPSGKPLQIKNPLSESYAVMRRNILPNIIEAIRRNLNRGATELSFFEVGHVFREGKEPHHLAIAFVEAKDRQTWWEASKTHPFYRMKGVFEALQSRLSWTQLELKPSNLSYLNPEEALAITFKGAVIGGLGSLSSNLLRIWDLSAPVTVLELDLGFLNTHDGPTTTVQPLSPYPGMTIDMAFVLDKVHSFHDVHAFILSLRAKNLGSLSLFDAFEGKAVGANKRSLGFRFRFQRDDRSLTNEEVAAQMERVVASVQEKFGAIVRM